MLAFRARRKLAHLWTKFRPIYRVNGAQLPAHADTVGLINWVPNWKSQIIDESLKRAPGLFIDVGTNVGHTLIDYFASTERSGYLGFEPNPECVARMIEIIGASDADDCFIIPVGLSNVSTVLQLYFDPARGSDAGATAVGSDLRPANNTKAMHVAVFQFDDIAPSTIGDRRVSLVKIDVEGAELEVMLGMSETIRTHRPRILFEVLNRLPGTESDRIAERNSAVMHFLKSRGYTVNRIEKDSVDGLVTGLAPVDEFPNEEWSVSNKHKCDYLAIAD